MNKFLKMFMDSALMVVLMGMIVLPIGFMTFMKLDEKPVVLSAQDSKVDQDTTVNKLPENIPPEVEKYIMKIETEYYQSTSSATETVKK